MYDNQYLEIQTCCIQKLLRDIFQQTIFKVMKGFRSRSILPTTVLRVVRNRSKGYYSKKGFRLKGQCRYFDQGVQR